MKLPSLAAAVVFSTLLPAFAITDSEITPAALVGKTLTFTIVKSSAPLATNGTWSGTFAASGNGFTAAKITGDFVNISTTYAVTAHFVGETDGSFDRLVSGVNEKAYFGLYNQNGIGVFDIGLTTGIMEGTFTIGTPVVAKTPKINVIHEGAKLTDGSAKIGFGKVKIGKAGITDKFVIKNSGKAKLTGLKIGRNGTNKLDFSVTALAKTSLAAGESMSFKVTFKPSSTGKKSAAIHISSNDANESPFDIKLTGEGTK